MNASRRAPARKGIHWLRGQVIRDPGRYGYQRAGSPGYGATILNLRTHSRPRRPTRLKVLGPLHL